MSKKNYRKLLMEKQKHKAELAERVRVSQERVWQGDIDKYNENKLRGAIVQDLHNICNTPRWGARLMAFIKVEQPPPYVFGENPNKKGEIVDRLHPFVSKFHTYYTNGNLDLDYISKKSLSQMVDVFKRANMLDVDGNKTFEECSTYEDGIGYHNVVINAMFNIARKRGCWAKDIDLWRANPDATDESNVISLVRYLFATYTTPAFLEKYWLQPPNKADAKTYQEWYVNLGKGENLRTQKGLPVPITKKIAHYVVQAPPTYSVNHAIRWGQIHNMGGSSTHVVAINNTPLGESFANDEFWMTVVKFFIDNTFLDVFQYRNIYDYINAQKFVNPAPQPNFTMRGREPNTLVQNVDRWHQEIVARRQVHYNSYAPREKYDKWNSCGISGLVYKVKDITYRIDEILTANDLWEEGKKMHHCVGSYDYLCGRGEIAVYSLYKEEEAYNGEIEKARMATIEVRVKDKRIVQARKACNMPLDSDDLKIISLWRGRVGVSGI